MKNMSKTFLIFILSIISQQTFSQCTGSEPVLFLGNDTTICQGASLTLSAPNGYTYYNWSDNTHNQSITVNSTGTYSVEVGLVQNTNLVTNGTFESGNTGFTTGYAPGSGGAYGTLSNPGEYAVTTNPNLVHMYFSSCVDHTPTGLGRMLVVNGSGTPNTTVWQQTISVTPNTNYQFGAWVMSVVATAASDLAQLQFSINGVQMGAIFSPSQTSCLWSQFTSSWNSGANTTAIISIIGQNTVNTGNDFALDDITFKPVCVHTDAINVTVSPLPTQTTTLVGPSACASGTADGSITINCATAVQYSFDGGATWQTSNTQTGLSAGTYTVMSKNAAGCTVSSTVTLNSIAVTLTQTTVETPVTVCTGTPNGSITVTCATATQYSFDGGVTWQASNSATGLAAGTYTVISKNAAGCTVSSTVIIANTPTTPSQTVVVGPVNVCTGPPDGSITITCATATQYSFDGGTTWQASNVSTGMAVGTYTVMSQDAGGCTTTSTETITSALSAPNQTTSFVSPTPCIATPDGSITVISPTATQYSFNGGTTWQPSNIATGLAAGTYTVMSQDAAGCSTSSTVVITDVVSGFAQTTAVVPVTSCTTPNGSITVTALLATQYSFDGGVTWQASNVKTGLAAGLYTVMSQNSLGCNVSSAVTISTNIVNPTQTTASTPVTVCTGTSDGSITVTSPTATQYSFDGGGNWQASNVQTGLAAGTYTVMSQDALGCTASTAVTISTNIVNPTQTTASTPVTVCTGTSDGSITVTSPTANQYSFDGGVTWQVANVQTGLSAGTYTVMSQNAGGCTATSTVVINSTITVPIQTTSAVQPSACSLTPDGAITIMCATATQYSFDGGTTWQAQNTQTGLLAGTYTVMSQNNAGCTSSSSVTLTGVAGTPPTMTVSNDITICQNGTANISAAGSGGTTFIYHWDDFTNTNPTQSFTPTVTGYYAVQVENETGCMSEKDSILVTVLAPLSATVSAPVSVCPGEVGILSVSGISGGQAPYTVTWSAGMTIVGSGTTYSASVPSNTTYTVGVMDACQSSPLILTTGINLMDFQIPMFTIDDATQCEPAIFNLQNTLDPSLIETSVWTISNGTSFVDQNQISLTDYEVGTYSVTLSVTSKSGCVDEITLTDGLIVYPNPVANFTFTPTNVYMFDTNVDFINQSTGAVEYIWRIEDGSPNSATSVNVSSTFPEGVTGEYDVLLVAISEHQCVDSVMQIVTVYPEQIFYAPNAFTPNGDEMNQTWKVYMSGYDFKNFDLSVFNRWGELIWHTNDVNSEWDGTYKGNKVSDGVYTWSLVTKDIVTDKKYYYRGHLNIIR